VADMPTPAELIKKIEAQGPGAALMTSPGGPPPGGGARAVAGGGAMMAAPAQAASPRALSFTDVVALAQTKRDVMLYAHLRQSAHLVRFAPPVIELRLEPEAPRDLLPRLGALLEAETGRRWTIALSHAPGEPTLDAAETAAETAVRQTAAEHPLVRAILTAFPGARIEKMHAAPAPEEPELPADWAAFAPPDEITIEGDDA